MPDSAFTTDSIRFNTSGLMLRKNEPARQLWLNAFNDVIEFRAFDLPPDIPVRLSDVRGLRAFYDSGAVAQQGSVIGLEVRAVQSIRAVLLELQLPAQPRGSTFVASITLPLRDGSFVIKAQAIEVLGFSEADLNNPPPLPTHAAFSVIDRSVVAVSGSAVCGWSALPTSPMTAPNTSCAAVMRRDARRTRSSDMFLPLFLRPCGLLR